MSAFDQLQAASERYQKLEMERVKQQLMQHFNEKAQEAKATEAAKALLQHARTYWTKFVEHEAAICKRIAGSPIGEMRKDLWNAYVLTMVAIYGVKAHPLSTHASCDYDLMTSPVSFDVETKGVEALFYPKPKDDDEWPPL